MTWKGSTELRRDSSQGRADSPATGSFGSIQDRRYASMPVLHNRSSPLQSPGSTMTKIRTRMVVGPTVASPAPLPRQYPPGENEAVIAVAAMPGVGRPGSAHTSTLAIFARVIVARCDQFTRPRVVQQLLDYASWCASTTRLLRMAIRPKKPRESEGRHEATLVVARDVCFGRTD
jgi:hypothetical protein